ncbi:MAG: phosphatase PAP2 family protein [Eubacteriales bacterium]|nr:phosphatase PAP2 family protein [Eubacteriales bacterium]
MELRFLDWVQTLRTPAGDFLVPLITGLGDSGLIWIILTAVLLILPKMRRTGAVVLTALLTDVFLCNLILKPLVARSRPFDVNTAVELLIGRPDDFSFPSGHTAASFAVVAALYLSGSKKLWKAALLVAVLIAGSRLYLYVHYPTDIFGGIAVGIASGVIGFHICRHLSKRAADRKSTCV